MGPKGTRRPDIHDRPTPLSSRQSRLSASIAHQLLYLSMAARGFVSAFCGLLVRLSWFAAVTDTRVNSQCSEMFNEFWEKKLPLSGT